MTATGHRAELPVPVRRLGAVAGLLREVADQKRIRTAESDASLATRAFVRAWSALVDGADPARVAAEETAAAVAGARLAGLDVPALLRAGLTSADADGVRRRAIDEVAGALDPDTVGRLHRAGPPAPRTCPVPRFVAALARQPRAGATAPGRPRLIVEPPENHAEHCWATAVFGALLADDLGAEPADAFLLGLAHHLHNATLPDAGFAGETLLGEHLEPVVERLTEAELADLAETDAALAEHVRGVLAARADAASPLGATFHAADVLDRVLQVHHHARAAAFTARDALVDLDAVHDSPVAGYQRAVVDAAGLAAG